MAKVSRQLLLPVLLLAVLLGYWHLHRQIQRPKESSRRAKYC